MRDISRHNCKQKRQGARAHCPQLFQRPAETSLRVFSASDSFSKLLQAHPAQRGLAPAQAQHVPAPAAAVASLGGQAQQVVSVLLYVLPER